MEGSRREKASRRLRALLALSISTLASLAGAELWCRAEYGVPIREKLPLMAVVADARRGYAMMPSTEHYTYERPVRVNALGLRGPEVPEKTADEIRVLCLGDSTTYGQGLAEDDTLPALLERDIAAGGKRARAVNGGLRGYGTEQELALLEDLGPRIRADFVVLFWYPNDLEAPDVAGTFARLAHEVPVEYDAQAPLEGLALWAWSAKQFVRRSALVMEVHDVWSSLTAERLTPAEIDRGFERFDRSLADLARVAGAQGSRLLVAAIPTAGMVAAGEAGRAIPRRVGERAAAQGIAFVDLTEPLAELHRENGKLPLLPYDWHYTGEANRAMARIVAAELRKRFPETL
jgi:hypothetical protein